MKSKSFDLKKSPDDSGKHNKTYDFVGYYKSVETSKICGNGVSDESVNKEAFDSKNKADTPKHERSQKKKKNKTEPLDVSLIDAGLLSTKGRKQPAEISQHTSTPISTSKGEGKVPIVKSIMKSTSVVDEDTMDETSFDTSSFKPKKRNKSVSFMLDDNEEVAMKKTKSDDSLIQDKINSAKKKSKLMKSDLKKLKKIKKQMQAEKENNVEANTAEHVENGGETVTTKKSKKPDKAKPQPPESIKDSSDGHSQVDKERKKKFKKLKKQKVTNNDSEPTETESNNNEETEHREKKLKKKKRHSKPFQNPDTTETEGEPASKSRKKEIKPEIVAEDLENLTIGDNPHTLTNLLDDMTVVDKDKKKKNKLRKRKDKKSPTASVSNSETTDLEKIEEGKEKIKWKKRKWNKDKKADIEGKLATTVVVENLPFSILIDYKSLLSEHFGKCGIIQRIGVAEMYPAMEPKDVFTTTLQFDSEAAATKALEENNTMFHGSRILVSHPLSPTMTTVVVRSYGELSEHAISSVFSSAGRVRNIKLMVKGRKAMATAFVEFDGPQAVERAIKMAADARIGGKKIHVNKFELRSSRKPAKTKTSADSENEGGSEDSND